MLKALELHGFKSFADRARFEFPAGITVIVGPNGSGKSNIVDAIKWVLGEQSAKSLRGKEMADVIFKGSEQSGRRPMNTAEATLVFENADKRLPIDAPEVHITRRVYRSGEGEYLINRQPARLKDIRDLFRGTGVGVDAYSLIEQGKVDRMLQASAKDRRAMFEEAAGISRFKAKKVESQRRLERVEQNMLRLADIVEEVENRLKTVRAQAGKARRYREYSQRLQQLRTQIALVDFRRLSEEIARVEADLAAAHEETLSADAQAQRLESEQLALETAALTAGEELRNCESQIASAKSQIAGSQAAIEHERQRAGELEEERVLQGRNLLALSDKAVDLRTRLRATQAEVEDAESAQAAAHAELAACEQRLADLNQEYDRIRKESEARRQRYVAELQAAATLSSRLESAQNQLAFAQQAVATQEQRQAELQEEVQRLTIELDAVTTQQTQVEIQLAEHHEQVEGALGELTESRNLHASRAGDLAQLHGRQQGIAERAGMLEEFERTLEGVGAGVKEILTKAGENAPAPWSLVRGVVADFVKVAIEHASALDVALGDTAQAIVVDGGQQHVARIAASATDLSGRIQLISRSSFGLELNESVLSTQYSVLSTQLALSDSQSATPTARPSQPTPLIDLTAAMVHGVQVIARADKLVECTDEYRPLVELLLGKTFVVRTLADAYELRGRAPQGARFATPAGELIDERGVLACGPRQSATSLISRRSQLRQARLDLAVLDQQIIDAERETAHLRREVERHEARLRDLAEAGKSLDHASHQLAASHTALAQHLDRSRAASAAALSARDRATEESQHLTRTILGLKQDLAAAQTQAEATQAELVTSDERRLLLEATRHEAASHAMTAKVNLARCDQRLESLRHRLAQFEDDSRDRDAAIAEAHRRIGLAQSRLEVSAVATLTAAATIAQVTLRQQTLEQQIVTCRHKRDEAAARRAGLTEVLATTRRRAVKLRDKEHELSLAIEQVRHQRQTLADRLREDYSIELADLTDEPSPEEAAERAAVEEEIESLRRKINQIGAVNLDALEELDDLEQRFARLDGQYKDLAEAKASLERIIHKINADSRRLFLDTLEAIRLNFQQLYRKAFGGGKADLVLEEGVDVLECGVEIIATPPGKPSFNNSLLSGGEKALTAVALLLAIFQFRPSPFCILDEVDAPFDEANIGRFIDVLKDFLGWTRFVIVTHSKKTMTAATTLYGVTMQESGVSKRVSVRFDDVSDDGQIRREALDRTTGDDLAEHAA
jgi:chromosome segregation protein